ncbi:hypothetical protein D9M69_610400 [compost metagenome]
MRGFFRLGLGHSTKALKGFDIALTEATDIAFDIAFQRGIDRLNPHDQTRFGQDGRAKQ